MKALSELENNQEVRKPSLGKFFTEPIRAFKEKRYALDYLQKQTIPPQGDGHPILVIPGFLGDDSATYLLRAYLSKLGYTPFPWDMGYNLGNIKKINLLLDKIHSLNHTYQRRVILIGWSLGGIYARQLAKEQPHLVEKIITLGAPFAGMELPNRAAWLFKLINNRRPVAETDKKWLVDIPSPAPVPTLAFYSKEDGIVPWQACMEPFPSHIHENAEVKGSHVGLPHNIQMWKIMTDYLIEK